MTCAHDMEALSALLTHCEGNPLVAANSHHKGQWYGDLTFLCQSERSVEHTIELPVIWDVTLMRRHLNDYTKCTKSFQYMHFARLSETNACYWVFACLDDDFDVVFGFRDQYLAADGLFHGDAHHIPQGFSALPLWCHDMEILSTLLALCQGNSTVTGEIPSQRPVMRSFDFRCSWPERTARVDSCVARDLRRHDAHLTSLATGLASWQLRVFGIRAPVQEIIYVYTK